MHVQCCCTHPSMIQDSPYCMFSVLYHPSFATMLVMINVFKCQAVLAIKRVHRPPVPIVVRGSTCSCHSLGSQSHFLKADSAKHRCTRSCPNHSPHPNVVAYMLPARGATASHRIVILLNLRTDPVDNVWQSTAVCKWLCSPMVR